MTPLTVPRGNCADAVMQHNGATKTVIHTKIALLIRILGSLQRGIRAMDSQVRTECLRTFTGDKRASLTKPTDRLRGGLLSPVRACHIVPRHGRSVNPAARKLLRAGDRDKSLRALPGDKGLHCQSSEST